MVSTLPGRPLAELARRCWPVLQVEALDGLERHQLIRAYLAQYRKSLSYPQADRIASSEHAGNPLFLRVLLEEMRLWGDYETLNWRIEHYLAATSIPDLYHRVLERWEADYQRECPRLVRDTMVLLWAARRGLSEAELLDLVGTGGEPLPTAHWSPFYLAAEQSLASRAGLLGFGHDYLRQAVRDMYVPSEAERKTAHLRLADYFEKRERTPRRLDELPWQLAEAESWGRLCDLLANPGFLKRGWYVSEFDIRTYWARIEAGSPLRMVDVYRSVLNDASADGAWEIAELLQVHGHLSEAFTLQGHLIERHRNTGDRRNLAACLVNQANTLESLGDLDGALDLYKEGERICRELNIRFGLQISLGNQANVLHTRGDLDGAIALYKEQERICRELENEAGLAACLGNQANVLNTRGDLDGAMALHKKEERICRELGDEAGLAACLGNQASILHMRGDLDAALALYKGNERICRELGDKSGLQVCLGNQGLILHTRGDLDAAMALHKEQERVCRELKIKDGLQKLLQQRAVIGVVP